MWKILKFSLYLLLLSVSTSCLDVVRTVKVTQLVPYTIEVTRVVSPTVDTTKAKLQTVTSTPIIPITAVLSKETVIPSPQPTKLNINIDYYNGIVTIAQYYTLLDQGLYKEAYNLLSSSMPHIKTLENYVSGAKAAFKKVKIIVVQPYNEWAKQQGYIVPQDPMNKIKFFTQIIAEGEGNMSGSAMNGEVQTLFITLILENGEWKIYSISTSP